MDAKQLAASAERRLYVVRRFGPGISLTRSMDAPPLSCVVTGCPDEMVGIGDLGALGGVDGLCARHLALLDGPERWLVPTEKGIDGLTYISGEMTPL